MSTIVQLRAVGTSMVWLGILGVVWLGAAAEVRGAVPSARIVKVLPHLVDRQGRIALSPSLYERDAYQAHLRKTPLEQGGMRFDVQWKSNPTNQFALRIELRGNKAGVGTSLQVEQKVKYTGFFSSWSKVSLTREDMARLGELSAWRATLWDGARLVAEQRSFLWNPSAASEP